MSKLSIQPRLFFFAGFILLASSMSTVSAYIADPVQLALNAQYQQPVQHPRLYTPAQWEYIKRLFHGLTLGTLSEDQQEEIEEFFEEPLHQLEQQQQQVQQYQQEDDDDKNKYIQPQQQEVTTQQYQQQEEEDDDDKNQYVHLLQQEVTTQQYQQQEEEDDDSEEDNCPGYKGYPGNLSFYLQFDGISWIKRPCPDGLGFDPEKCACVIILPSYKTTTTTTTTRRTNPTTTTMPTTTTTTTTTGRPTTTTTRPTTTTTTPTTTRRTTTTTVPTTTTTPAPTTTTRRTTTGKPSLDLCKDCVILHGVGYAPYPGHCDAYVQCLYYGDVPSSVNIRRCPQGLQWSQNKLTCDYPENVQCKSVTIACPNQRAISGDIFGYLQFNGYTWTQVRCPPNKIYNELVCDCASKGEGIGNFETCLDKKAIPNDRTGFLQLSPSGWVRMPCPKNLGYDTATCRCTDILGTDDHYTTCPNLKPIPGDRTGYLQFNGVSWIRMPCPATVGYNARTCQCSDYLIGSNSESVDKDDDICKPSLRLTFDDNSAADSSHNQFWVNNTGVTFSNGKAHFDGNARLTVPGFSNMELGDEVFITIKYSQTGNDKQTMVTNGDCGVLQSLGVCSGKDSVDFYAETSSQQAKVTVTKMTNTWQYVMFSLYKNHLKGYVGTRSGAQEAKGSLARRQRGLVIGAGGECNSFTGDIDEIHVFLCQPGFA